MIVLKRKTMGFTLIEAAVIIMLLSIALIPIVKMVSGKAGDSGGKGVMTGATSGQLLSREKTVANTIMEKAIAGDYSSIRSPVAVSTGAVSGTVGSILSFQYDPTSTNFTLGFLKTDGSYEDTIAFTPEAGVDGGANATSGLSQQKYEFPKYQYGGSGVYYKWAIEDATLQQYTPTTGTYAGTSIYGSFMPKGNNLIKAILRVYTGDNAATSTTPDYVLSTYFYKNTAENAGGGDQFTDTIGIVLALDVSLSMRNANFVGNGGNDMLPATTTGGAYLNNASPATNAKLPMRNSSGLAGYDPQAVASPYLFYRSGVSDLFFAKGVDDTLTTQYDERYNPCYAAQTLNPLAMADYPGVVGGANAGGSLTDLLSTVAATKTEMDTNCSNPAGGTLPVGANADPIFVRVPTSPSAALQATVTAGLTGQSANLVPLVSNWGGASPSSEEMIYGDGCLDSAAVQNSTCPYVLADGFALAANVAGFTPVAVNDMQSTESLISSLYANPGDTNIVPMVLSRIEAARTAMLSFVLTIENNTALVDNFRLGLVPFSTVVNDGTTFDSVTYPDEIEILAEPNASSKFQDLKDKLYRLNRACDSGGYTYGQGISCPAGTNVFTMTGNTNIAQALLYSQRQFQIFDPANNKLAAKLVVLLTDGAPTKSATAWNNAMDNHASEDTYLQGVANTLHADNIDVYAIGLLTAGDSDAIAALNAIGNAHADNSVTYVDSVADLSPIFENIAQQAERLLLQAMKDRYQYLDY